LNPYADIQVHPVIPDSHVRSGAAQRGISDARKSAQRLKRFTVDTLIGAAAEAHRGALPANKALQQVGLG